MMEFLSYGVAAWIGYETIRAVIPLPEWLLPFVVLALCFAATLVPPVVLTVLHAAAVVALLRLGAGLAARPMPLMPAGTYRKPLKRKQAATGRIPDLP